LVFTVLTSEDTDENLKSVNETCLYENMLITPKLKLESSPWKSPSLPWPQTAHQRQSKTKVMMFSSVTRILYIISRPAEISYKFRNHLQKI
jgi:hypothetical protein